eukprot:TRINITY_DN19678_c0_g4_i1.p1 TRINITY_DN19678_c0_g4~~TRINITY_DN19678_c0_g4_i1.p1  ORF type:complete len:611 (-),score=84.33 TRINITY_DN19678_c0_g4_i1:193-2025(-)
MDANIGTPPRRAQSWCMLQRAQTLLSSALGSGRSRSDPASSHQPSVSRLGTYGSLMPTISEVNRQAVRHLTLEDESLLRGIFVTDMLRDRARIMADHDEWAARSYGFSSPVDHIDAFISHNWSTPRRQKFLTLAYHFNAIPAALAASAAALVALILTLLGVLPVFPEHGELNLNRHVGFGCQLLGTLVFVLTLLFWHELGARLCCKGPVVFLDKSCVHQTDMELKCKGILSLAAFLSYSWSMVVLYSDVYLKKLWTVYEIATFMLMFPQGNLHVRPVFFPRVVLSGIMLVVLIRILNAVVWSRPFQNRVSYLRWHPFLDEMVFGCLADLPLVISMTFILHWWARQQEQMQAGLREFDIHNAVCAREEDRVIVENNVIVFSKHFGLVEPFDRREDVLAAFNALVLENVPRALEVSLGRAGVQYKDAASIFTVYHFYTLDCFGGMFWHLDECSWYWACMIFVSNSFLALCCGPLAIAISAWLARYFVKRRNFADKRCTCKQEMGARCITFIMVLFVSWLVYDGSYYAMLHLCRRAVDSTAALHGVIGLYAVYGWFTYAVYRPLRATAKPGRRLGVAEESSSASSTTSEDAEGGALTTALGAPGCGGTATAAE